ncbi:MAG: dihydroxyacetone kinase subunit DhaK [Treponema sp.]|jgi:dihydroxyacetone kinase|nr:dihydroxyacetone kinase subunit DhaK [Treponema sp.]
MKKILNNPADIMDETMAGYALSNQKRLYLPPGTHSMMRKKPKERGKVRLVVGNGGGHEPGLMGWVGFGMYDLDCLGNIFTAQSGKVFFEAIKEMGGGSPILLTIANHAGDVANGNLAFSLCRKESLEVEKVLFYDDIASAPKGQEEDRRGMAGMMFSIKCAGAMAEKGASLAECVRVFEKARDNVRTIALTLGNCTHPATGLQMMETPVDKVGLGAGVHGESGALEIPFAPGRELAKVACDMLIEDKPFKADDEVCVLVNGMGSTTMMELSIFYRDVSIYLESRGIKVYDGTAGNYITTQEMAGLSLSFMKLDDELKRCWDAPCSTPAYTNC